VVLAESRCVSGGTGGREGVYEGTGDVWTRKMTRMKGRILVLESRDVVINIT
jgi:hypothetical protein